MDTSVIINTKSFRIVKTKIKRSSKDIEIYYSLEKRHSNNMGKSYFAPVDLSLIESTKSFIEEIGEKSDV